MASGSGRPTCAPPYRLTALPPYRFTPMTAPQPRAVPIPQVADAGGEAAPARPHEAPGHRAARRHGRRVRGDPHPGAAAPWLGYVRATAEAAMVGGLADWFADHGAVPPSAQHPDPPHRHHPQPQGPDRPKPRQLRPEQLPVARGARPPSSGPPRSAAARPSGSDAGERAHGCRQHVGVRASERRRRGAGRGRARRCSIAA